MRDRDSVRTILRTATASLHERLHRNRIFHGLLRGRLTLPGYRTLLLCLHGFHAPMEARLAAAMGVCGELALSMNGRRRAHLLVEDLRDLGTVEAIIADAPACEGLPDIRTPAQLLDSLYVVDGSRLGGDVQAAAATVRDTFSAIEDWLGRLQMPDHAPVSTSV